MSLASSLPDELHSESSFLKDYESAPQDASQYPRTGGLRPASRYSQAVEAYRPQSPPSPPLHAQRFSLPPRPGLQQTRTSDWLENVRRSPRPPSPGRRAFISAETTNDDIHSMHNRLRRRIAALLDDLDQSPPLLPLSLPFGDVGSEENGGQDADEPDRESWLAIQQARPSVDRMNMNRTHVEASRPMSNTTFIHSFSRNRRPEFNDSWPAGSAADAFRVASATRRESIEPTQRFAAMSTSVSQR